MIVPRGKAHPVQLEKLEPAEATAQASTSSRSTTTTA
jgi:hypothetical protein